MVVRQGERFGLPLGSTPSTHILKPVPLTDDGTPKYPGLAEVEYFCMQVARDMAELNSSRTTGLGFRVPKTEMIDIGSRTAILVERYDRHTVGGVTRRIHQEDACQVLGILPGAKYQRLPEGPPSFRLIAEALNRWGTDPVLDQRALLQALTFTVLCGNADLHAKNVSYLHHEGFRLAPLYDIVSTRLYESVDLEMGMRVGTKLFVDEVRATDLVEEAASWALGPSAAARAIRECAHTALEVVPGVLDAVHERDGEHPQVDALAHQLVERARQMESSPDQH